MGARPTAAGGPEGQVGQEDNARETADGLPPLYIVIGRMRQALLASSTLRPMTKNVGLAMLEFVNRETYRERGQLHVWPSRDRFDRLVGIKDHRTRKHAFVELLQAGVVEVVHRGGRGPRDTTRYLLRLDWLFEEERRLEEAGVLSLWPGRGNADGLKGRTDTGLKGRTDTGLKGGIFGQARGAQFPPDLSESKFRVTPTRETFIREAAWNPSGQGDSRRKPGRASDAYAAALVKLGGRT